MVSLHLASRQRSSSVGMFGVKPERSDGRQLGQCPERHSRAMGLVVRLIVILCGIVAGVFPLSAQTTYFWVGGASVNWGSPANWSLSSGGAGGAGVPGVPYGNALDVAIFDSGSPNIGFGFPATVGRIFLPATVTVNFNTSTAATTLIVGGNNTMTQPLFVGALSTLVLNGTMALPFTLQVGNATTSPVCASIFGSISTRQFTTIVNNSGIPFQVEDGGTLRMTGGTYTNMAGTIAYALTGARGTLMYDNPAIVTVTIPAQNMLTDEVQTATLGNLYIRRAINAPTTFGGMNYFSRGTLTVDGCTLTLPNPLYYELSASRMLNGGLVQGNPFAATLYYVDQAAPNALNPATSDLTFTAPQALTRLVNEIPTLNLSVNSDLKIYGTGAGSGLQIGAMAAGGQVTIPASRTMTIIDQAGMGVTPHQIFAATSGRLNVNGTFVISSNATMTNNNPNINSPLAGIVVGANGKITIWGNGTVAGSILGTADGTYYTNSTSILEYRDQDATIAPFNAAPYSYTAAPFNFTQPVVRDASTAELPTLMLGSVIINRQTNWNGGAPPANDVSTAVRMKQNTTLRGSLTLTQGGLSLFDDGTMTGFQLIAEGAITSSNGGYVAGAPAINASAFVYRGSAAASIRITTATMTLGNIFNYVEVGGAGNLGINGTMVINGDSPVATYGLAGISNYNGQLRFTGAGNLVLNSSTIRFEGNGAANLTPAAQGGHVPVTTGSVGAIYGDTGARLEFNSTNIRSFPRFAAGGQNLAHLVVGNTAAVALTDYMVSMLTPITVNAQVILRNNSILQLGPGANLTSLNPTIGGDPPSPMGNFIDASRGSSLTLRNAAVGPITLPVGVSFVGAAGAMLQSAYRPITLQNALAGENYTVSVTSAIQHVVAAIPTLPNNSARAQWTVSKGSPAYNGTVRVDWGNNVYVPATGFGDEPAGAGEFQVTQAAYPNLTTLRTWNGSTYITAPYIAPVTLGPPRNITGTFNGNLSSTIFIVTNELFPIYWVGGANNNWNVNTNWAATSGGTPGSANVPGINDWAVFDRAVTTTITQNFPAQIQQLSIIENATVTFSPNIPSNMILGRDQAGDNLYIGKGSRLTLGGTTSFPMTLQMANTLNPGPNATVFGNLTLNPNSTFNDIDMTSTILIANGGTLQMGGGTLVKDAATVLAYGRNQNSVSPYTIGAPAEPNATLRYEDNNGGVIPVTPAATNELPVATLDANLVVNKTVAGGGLSINSAVYTITTSVTVQAGTLDLTGGRTLTIGTYNPAPVAPAVDATARTITVAAAGNIRGDAMAVMNINGPGSGNLRFETGFQLVNNITLDDLTNTIMGGRTGLTSITLNSNLGVNGALTLTNAATVVGSNTRYGFIVASPNTLTLNGASVVTSGRMLAGGTVAISNAGTLALPAALVDGGLDVSTGGTLNLIDNGAVTGMLANPVRYLDVTSILKYGALVGMPAKLATDMEFPQLFHGTLVVDKTGFSTDVVQMNGCKAVTQGTIQLVIGDLMLNGHILKIGGGLTTFADNNISATARVLNGGGFFRGDNAAGTSGLIYDASQNSNIFMGATGSAVFTDGRFLNKMEINGVGNVTLATSSTLVIDGMAGVNACDGTNRGLLRTDLSTGSLVLNGSRLLLDGADPVNGGALLTSTNASVAGGAIIGDAGTGTSIRFQSQRTSSLKVGTGTGAQFHTLSLGDDTGVLSAVTPAGAPYVTLHNPATVVTVGVTRGILSLGTSAILTVSGTGVNSTSGTTPASLVDGFADFGTFNNNFIDCSPGGQLRLTIPAGQQRMFPVGAMNNAITTLRPAPVLVQNGSGASDTYTVGVKRGLTNQGTVYVDRVNLEWYISKGTGSGTNDLIQLGWHQEHETGVGFIRGNSYMAQWNGATAYTTIGNAVNDPAFPGTPTTAVMPNLVGPDYTQTQTIVAPTYSTSRQFVVIAPPTAVILAADSLSFLASGGFNPATPDGFASPAGGNLTVTSGQAFKLRISSFNGLNQRAPAVNAAGVMTRNLYFNLHALPGGNAVFSTTGNGGLVLGVPTPVTLSVAGQNPVSATTTNITFNWVNPGNQASTQATLVIWDDTPGVGLISATLTITVLAPVQSPIVIAYENRQYTGASTATFGFNGGSSVSQFNILGGTAIPMKFGLYGWDGLLKGTNATVADDRRFIVTITNPPGGTAIFSTTQTGIAGSVTDATLTLGANNGTLSPIFNWVGYDINTPVYPGTFLVGPYSDGKPVYGLNPPIMGGGVKQPNGTTTAIVTIQTFRKLQNGEYLDIMSTSVTVQISSGATVATTLAYTTISGALNSEFIRTYSPVLTPPNTIQLFPAPGEATASVGGFNAGNLGTLVPILSSSQLVVHVGSFGANGAIIPPASPTEVQLSITAHPANPTATFSVDNGTSGANASVVIPTTTGTATLTPRFFWTNPTTTGLPPVQAIVTLTRISGSILSSTQLTITISSTSTIPFRLAYNTQKAPENEYEGALGFSGIGVTATTATTPVVIESGRSFDMSYGALSIDNTFTPVFNHFVNWSIAPDPSNPADTYIQTGTLQAGNIQYTATGLLSGAIVHWTNAPAGAGPFTSKAIITLNGTNGFGGIISTTAVITITSSATVPVALAYSTVSSTGTQTLPQTIISSGQSFNLTLGLFSARNLPAPSLTNVPITLTAVEVNSGQAFQVFPSSTGPFVNQSQININGVQIIWPNAPATNTILTTQVRITASAMGVVPPILATSGIITLSTSGTAPVIFSITPSTGQGGTQVIINGANFNGVNSVLFGASPASIISVAPTQIVVTAPANLGPGNYVVTVSRPAGVNYPAGSGNFSSYLVPTPCTSLTFTPSSGGSGQTMVINSGTSTDLSSVSVVTVAGIPATITNKAVNAVTVTLGQGTPGLTGPVVITNNAGTCTSVSNFTYNAAPNITTVSPLVIPATCKDIQITITGTNFTTTKAGAEGTFFGVGLNPFANQLTEISRSATQVVALVPAVYTITPGSRTVTVRNEDGQIGTFTVQVGAAPAPSILSVTPTSTTASGHAFTIIVSGQNFAPTNCMTVTANGGTIPFTSNGSDKVFIYIDPETNSFAKTLNFVIRNTDGQQVQTTVVINAARRPEITGVIPSRITVGSPNTKVRVYGKYFMSNGIFSVGGVVVAANFIAQDSAEIVIPATMLTTVRTMVLELNNRDLQKAAAAIQVVRAAPTITSITPSTNASQFSFIMTINGTNFRTGLAVLFNGGTLTDVQSVNDTQIRVRVPVISNKEGTHTVTVVNDDQQTSTATFRIGRYTGPTITNFTPSVTTANGSAFDIAITGTNLTPGLVVTFGGTPLQIKSVSPDSTKVVAFVPAGLNTIRNANIELVVTNPDGQAEKRILSGTNVRNIPNPIEARLYPNPVSEDFVVEAAIIRSALVTIRLADAVGRTYIEVREHVPAGAYRKQFDINALPPGIYLFEMFDGERRFVEKVIKH